MTDIPILNWHELQCRAEKLAAELDDAKSVIVAQSAGLRMLRERVTTLEGENARLRAELDELSRSK